jgi:hypothetical protein
MNTPLRTAGGRGALSLPWLALLTAAAAAAAPAHSGTSATSRLRQYLMANEAREVALARSAAPPSLSAHATIMVLTPHGYVAAARGDNGFVCLVARSWDNSVAAQSARFWDPRFRAPYCFNRAAARSVLTRYLMRTRWVLAGASQRGIGTRERAARRAGRIAAPMPGAMSYMMSREGRGIGGQQGPWRPHLMFYFPRARAPNWGANLKGNPVYGNANADAAVRYVLVPVWSDGSPAPAYR